MICDIFQLKNFCENNSFNKSFNSIYTRTRNILQTQLGLHITLFYWKQLSCDIIPNTLGFHFDMANVYVSQKIFIGFINNVRALNLLMKKVFPVEGKIKVSVKLTIAIWCVICFNTHFIVVLLKLAQLSCIYKGISF